MRCWGLLLTASTGHRQSIDNPAFYGDLLSKSCTLVVDGANRHSFSTVPAAGFDGRRAVRTHLPIVFKLKDYKGRQDTTSITLTGGWKTAVSRVFWQSMTPPPRRAWG